MFLLATPQVEYSGHWILRESHLVVQEIARIWKQYADRKVSRYFPVDSCELSGRKSSEKFPLGILLLRNHRNRPGCVLSNYLYRHVINNFFYESFYLEDKWKLFLVSRKFQKVWIILFYDPITIPRDKKFRSDCINDGK